MRATLLVLPLLALPAAAQLSLAEAFDAAGPGAGYDKLLTLQPGQVYTGGLIVGRTFDRITATYQDGPLVDVGIVGNGAILDLEGQELVISYCDNRLDLSDCVVLNGNLRYESENSGSLVANPVGAVRQVTFYRPHDFAVRVPEAAAGVLLERNLVVDPVDTGPDFHFATGYANDWIPTGSSFALSVNSSLMPTVIDNWSWFSDPTKNQDPNAHFTLLCRYG